MKTKKVNRSASSGRFVDKQTAQENPREVISDSVSTGKENPRLWIARDGDKASGSKDELWLYPQKPVFEGDFWSDDESLTSLSGFILPNTLFPEVKNGECAEVEISLVTKD